MICFVLFCFIYHLNFWGIFSNNYLPEITPLLISIHNFISFIFIYVCNGINWCFVSYSFVSVKGPGRKLSLPTDLKTDLGTVGESQQFSF